MIHIAFIGNCQTVSLCFFLQKLLVRKPNYIVKWCLYGDEFTAYVSNWSEKCRHKIVNYDESLEYIKICDYVIYQEISKEKSVFSNEDVLTQIKKNDCKLIKMPSIFLEYSSYEASLKELITRETDKNVDIKVSQIIHRNKPKKVMLTKNHPNTFLFLEIIKEICNFLNIEFFDQRSYSHFVNNPNYMELPT